MNRRMLRHRLTKPLIASLLALWTICQAQSVTAPPSPATPEPAAQEAWRGLKQQASELTRQGKYDEALVVAQQALALAERTWGDGHPDVATSLSDLAELLNKRGDSAAAEPLYRRCLAIRERTLGPDHLDVAVPLNGLAIGYWNRGDYDRAAPLFQRSLAIRERALGPEHPTVAMSLNNLANLHAEWSDFAVAEPLYRRSLAIREKALGPDHPDVAMSLHNLAVLYGKKADGNSAAPLLQRSLAIWEKTLGPDHPDVAVLLNNLANVYLDLGDTARAEPLARRSLAIQEKALGADHPDVSLPLMNLAKLHSRKREYELAQSLLQRSLAISEKAFGPSHPDVATSLDLLANLSWERGDVGEVMPILQRSLAIREKALGPEHPGVAAVLSSMARMAWAQQDPGRALRELERAVAIEERHLDLILTTGAEAQKRAYAGTLQASTDLVISLHLQGKRADAASSRLAATTALRRKGRVLDAMTDSMAVLRRHLSAADQLLLDQLSSARSELAGWILKGPGDEPAEQYRARVGQLEARQQALEASISERSAEFRDQHRPVTIERIQQSLPRDAALVEWIVYQPVDPKLEPTTTKSMPRRYAAFVLQSSGDPLWFDLGEASIIDGAVSALRAALASAGSQNIRPLASRLYRLAVQPFQSRLDKANLLLLAPDSALNLVPFAALRNAKGHLLIEQHSLAYLSSARDLIRPHSSRAASGPGVIVAAPDFDMARQGAATTQAIAAVRRSADLTIERFESLPGTRSEASAIAQLVPGTTLLTGTAATADAVRQLRGPRILHIATHGFFLSDPDPGKPTAAKENPLLRSGLVFAGANQFAANGRDGILTALEAAGLDLEGTELVVLSACETGVGEVRNGEGVYGLRRALTIAGAKSQVMSLWQVEDQATRTLMVDYYRRLMKGEGRAEALRQAQLSLLRNPKLRHPFYWAAFIPTGQWGAL